MKFSFKLLKAGSPEPVMTGTLVVANDSNDGLALAMEMILNEYLLGYRAHIFQAEVCGSKCPNQAAYCKLDVGHEGKHEAHFTEDADGDTQGFVCYWGGVETVRKDKDN